MPVHTPLPPELTRGPFRTATAIGLGVSAKALTGRRFVRLFRDVYVVRERAADPGVRPAGALLLVPHGVVGHVTAARAWELPCPRDQGAEPVHLLVPRGSRVPRRAGLTLHAVPLPARDVAMRGGVPLAVPVRVLLDVGAAWCLGDLVAFADGAQARGLLDRDDLASRVAAATGRRGVAQVRVATGMLDGASPSGAASRTRVLLEVAGLPRPVHLGNARLGWPDHDVIMAVDERALEVLPQQQVRRAWDALRAAGWRPPHHRPRVHEALVAVGAFRTVPTWQTGRPA